MKLSIITVNLNNASGLEKTIKSVLTQSFNDFEFIIIDGGSADESVNVIKRYNDRITYCVSEPDKGIYNAMNKGIRKARGEYCLFLNSGDCLVNENVLEKVFFNAVDEQILYGDTIVEKNGSESTWTYPNENKFSLRFLLKTSLIHPTMFFKSTLFDTYGYYNENLKFASDWEFYLLAIFKHNVSIRKINVPIAKFDLTGISSDINNRKEMFAEREVILNKHFKYFLKDYRELERLDHSLPMKVYRFIKSIIFSPYKLYIYIKQKIFMGIY